MMVWMNDVVVDSMNGMAGWIDGWGNGWMV